MKFLQTSIADVLILEPSVFKDDRGSFFESFHSKKFEEGVGQSIDFVQDNQSCSAKGVLRGLHYQNPSPQGKLVRVLSGSVFDVAVDLRKNSATFGKWVGVVLSSENRRQLWIPEGFAHGFLALEEDSEVFYKATRHYAPQHEHTLLWSDPSVAIEWPALDVQFKLAPKDENASVLGSERLFDGGSLCE